MKRIFIALAILAVVALFAIYQSQTCTLSFDVHKGFNYNQPYPTYHHCHIGSNYPVLAK